MARIRLDNVSKKFGEHVALSDLSIDVANGEFFVLLGPTGAGKTTTLRLIAGLEKPTTGSIHINEVDVREWGPAERDTALVLQQYSLYPRLTVRDNLAFPLQSRVRKMTPAQIEQRIAYASKTLRIEHLLDRKTDRLSGGEMQRVSIGRAIVREPQVFLMDEPLSALDAKLRESLRSELKDLQRRLGGTFIFVTHDQVEAMTMGDRIAVLNHGRIVQVGTPNQIYNNPRDTFVASFVGSPAINLIAGRLSGGIAVMAPASFELPVGGKTAAAGEGSYTFGVRPEDVRVEPGAPVEARVHDIENHGIEKVLTLRVGDQLVRAAVPAKVNVAVEDAVRFGWNAEKVIFFDATTGVNLAHTGNRQPAVGNRETERTAT
jgi:multiple sugar transport system ATP-binding protein